MDAVDTNLSVSSITDTAGTIFHPLLAVSAGPIGYAWWGWSVSAVASTVTISLSGTATKAASAAWCYSGADTMFPVDQVVLPPGTGNSTSPLGGNCTTSRANEFLIAACMPVGGATITDPTNFNRRSTTGNAPAHFGDISEAAAGIYNPAWTISPGAVWIAFNMSITPPFTHGSVIFDSMNS
jgi:hypothetical protein